MCQLIGFAIQLSVSDSFILVLQGDGVRRSLDLLFKQFVEAFVFRIIRHGIVPFEKNLVALRLGHYWQRCNGLIRVDGDSFQ